MKHFVAKHIGISGRLHIGMICLICIMLNVGCSPKHRGHIAVHSDMGTQNLTTNLPASGIDITKMNALCSEACTWLGTPYCYASADKVEGTDCSGMVMRVYEKAAGIKLPRNSAKQAEYCRRLEYNEIRPGDLVFFATGKDPDRISHVGIMLDSVQFVHASTSKGVVISKVDTPYYTRTFKMYGRPE